MSIAIVVMVTCQWITWYLTFLRSVILRCMHAIRNGEKRRKKQHRPRGAFYPIDAVWKAKVREVMARDGISQTELARRIDAVPGSIILMLKPEATQSRLVPAIHKVLGLTPPSTTSITEAA